MRMGRLFKYVFCLFVFWLFFFFFCKTQLTFDTLWWYKWRFSSSVIWFPVAETFSESIWQFRNYCESRCDVNNVVCFYFCQLLSSKWKDMLHKPIMHKKTVKGHRKEVSWFQLSHRTEVPETQSTAHAHTPGSVTPVHKLKCMQKKSAKCISSSRWCISAYSQTCIWSKFTVQPGMSAKVWWR